MFLIFLNNSGLIASNYRKSLILRGYDVNKCEQLCMGESAFNLAIWQERLVDESWGLTRVRVL